MSTKVKFKVSDKLVKARDGASYDIKNYTEGVDYVMRGCFKGQKAVFRADILGVSIIDPSMVEHKQQQPEHVVNVEPVRVVAPELTPEDWRPTAPEPVKEQPVVRNEVQECKVMQVYPNFKWVQTDKGRVWVGLKGMHMRRGQVIKVKNGELYLGKSGPSGSLVKL
jgi:hypothetical protein